MTARLTSDTEKRIELLFASTDRDFVASLLVVDCGNNLPFLESTIPMDLERIRFAVLKVSCGNLNQLQQAIDTAKQDSRDVLMAAKFGSDVKAHESWWPTAMGSTPAKPHES